MAYIDADLDEHIQNIAYGHVRDWHQAAVTIVYDEVTIELLRGQIVDAACSVRDISEYQTFDRQRALHRLL